jgi:hypothetical protein
MSSFAEYLSAVAAVAWLALVLYACRRKRGPWP